MKALVYCTLFPFLLTLSPCLSAQVLLSGRVREHPTAGTDAPAHFTAIYCFASLRGSTAEARSFRTWETHPVGWYRISGSAGNYTVVFSNPADSMRPVVLTNIYMRPGERLDRDVHPRLEYAMFHDRTWDEKPASDYYQPFIAKGKGITHVGFKLATDGVDGWGPEGQNLLLSVHRAGDGTPDTWEQVGPAVPVLGVDCGGAKSYSYSAGWNSGEVPTRPGETYAVRLRAERDGGTFQAFWKPAAAGQKGCYRVGPVGQNGYSGHDIWLVVGGDSDGLLIPYQKRVHRKFKEFAGFRSRWSQTYVARGRGLASVILFAATSGVQPPLSRQRVRVRIRQGGPAGPVVGIEKIGVGNGNYTGDASWGTLGVAFAPGEVPLTPGETYAIEFESIESYQTLHGFVNIKGQVSDDKPGFNPYRKNAPDTYPHGTAYRDGREAMDFDLDLQVIEYESARERWADAVESTDLLVNGDMESGDLAVGEASRGRPDAWKAFTVIPGAEHQYLLREEGRKDRLLRIFAEGKTTKTFDAGFVQRVDGLSSAETYRLRGRVRCSWPVDIDRRCDVGYDPTGQVDDPGAATIVWTPLPSIHGVFVSHRSEPIRPREDAVSVWLRARSRAATDWDFKADFDDFGLFEVQTGVPTANPAETQ